MFYANFVLSKKGPLAKIWLAAHWDKKLTKSHIFETNICKSAEAILEPKVKMALRTSGHLLLGVVRIYSRKAKYLLNDVNEAFVKIKMAFRPGIVDLPEDQRDANIDAITLPDTFDTTLADLNNLDLQMDFTVNQSRRQDITLRESTIRPSFATMNPLLDDTFGGPEDLAEVERALANDGSISVYKDDRNMLNLDNADEDMMGSGDSSFEPPGVSDFPQRSALIDSGPPPADEDAFGAMDFFESGLVGNNDLFDEAHELVGETPTQPMSSTRGLDEISHATAGDQQTTLIADTDEAFALKPLDATSAAGEKRGRRKRRLIVDEQKAISSDQMKAQMADTSEIVTNIDLAPPTKKLMHWKETGGIEKLFGLPCVAILSCRLSDKVFNRCLVTRAVRDEEEDDLLAEMSSLDFERGRADSLIGRNLSNIEERSSMETSAADGAPNKRRRTDDGDQPSWQRDPSINDPSMLLPEAPSAAAAAAGGENSALADGLLQDQTLMPENITDQATAEELIAEKNLNRRAEQLLKQFRTAFRHNDSIMFSEIVSQASRQQAASRFFTLLALCKINAVETVQTEPYADIEIRRGVECVGAARS